MLKLSNLSNCCVGALLVVLLPAGVIQATGLPDTGQSLCYNGSVMVVCTESNIGDSAAYPGQDGRFGRDAVASAGQLTKIGGGDVGFDYTKVCNSGELAGQGSCPVDPILGSGANDWACTKDNVTGLIWEVKVNDNSHLRHLDWAYSWYSTDENTNAGNAGTADGSDNCLNTARCDTEKYTADVNSSSLCGGIDWRMPSTRELHTIIHYGRVDPAIDLSYFPNTLSSNFWSASSAAHRPVDAWTVYFYNGYDGSNDKRFRIGLVRLVRGAQF